MVYKAQCGDVNRVYTVIVFRTRLIEEDVIYSCREMMETHTDQLTTFVTRVNTMCNYLKVTPDTITRKQ